MSSSLSVNSGLSTSGTLEAYIAMAYSMPMLTESEERELALTLNGDCLDASIEAAKKLVMSHLKLVVSISRTCLNYGIPQADIIQEGTLGLMTAVKNFKPEYGVRLATYAVHWIKANIYEYILRNWRIVKLATTKAQRKLFYNLVKIKKRLQGVDFAEGESHKFGLTTNQVNSLALELDVPVSEVREMEVRLAGQDVSLNPLTTEYDDGGDTPSLYLERYLVSPNSDPVDVLKTLQREDLAITGVSEALASLDPRSKAVIEKRWINVSESGVGVTLHDLAAEFNVSAERIRQIEVAALKKMRKYLESFR